MLALRQPPAALAAAQRAAMAAVSALFAAEEVLACDNLRKHDRGESRRRAWQLAAAG